ncbi:type 1 glutamine amidotransferase domain-containing protein [Pseudomonas chlororaphis]|uniref:type 1 glutamine amidotransferase domain-containing protein n=1 Tax=Pseudomonas chlororaphis TaxID=587753 RepID=UPI000F4646C6|nr:type 1 glutamine amidotransferase domain-containing protein [Pseudomonas chlororaphis]ROL81161.1 type 1 glutamine amidotransferase domain-containing protein [Pseudomonas chlororaphis]
MMLKTLVSCALVLIGGVFMTFANAETNPSTAIPKDRQILVIMTNHASYPSRTDTTGLWLTELTHFTDVVEAAGYTTVFASPKGGAVPLDERSLGWLYMDKAAREHLQSPAFRARLNNTIPIADIDPSRFSAIYFTGGHGVMWDFPENPDLRRVAEKIYNQGGIVSAVCHGVAGLVDLKDEQGQALIKNRNITGFSNREELLSGMKNQVPFFLEDRLVGQGARYRKAWLPFTSFAITDGRLVTGQNPQSPRAVAEAVMALLSAGNKTR